MSKNNSLTCKLLEITTPNQCLRSDHWLKVYSKVDRMSKRRLIISVPDNHFLQWLCLVKLTSEPIKTVKQAEKVVGYNNDCPTSCRYIHDYSHLKLHNMHSLLALPSPSGR